MSDVGIGTEQPIASQKVSNEIKGGKWSYLKTIKNYFSRKHTQPAAACLQTAPLIQEEPKEATTQIPPESGYARWISGLEEGIKNWQEKKRDSSDQILTVNELTRLYPHLVKVAEKSDLQGVKEEGQKTIESLNNGNMETVIKLAGDIRKEYSKGQKIVALKKKPLNSLAPLELEAILADQLINRLQRQKENVIYQPVPQGIVNSVNGIDLDPNHFKGGAA